MKTMWTWMLTGIAGVMIAAALATAGCSSKPGVIFPALSETPRWPAPPDPARIFYVGQLSTSADLKPGVDGLEAIGQALFGKKDEHSMLTPMAACTDAASGGHRVFVVDSNAQLVHVFDLHTRKYATWAPGKKDPPFAQPVGIAWDSLNRRLLVSDSVAGEIFVFGSDGKLAGTLGLGILQRPVGMAVDPGAAANAAGGPAAEGGGKSGEGAGRIFVADPGAHQVVVLSMTGELIQRVGGRGTALGYFNYPTYVALDPHGLLYVSDSLNFRVQQFDRSLRPIRQIGRKGDMPGYFAEPKGIATDSEGHLYVVDGQFENVQIFDSEGHVLMAFGEEGNGPGQFWLPTAIFIDGRDRLWVSDSYNRRVQVFDYRATAAVDAEVKP